MVVVYLRAQKLQALLEAIDFSLGASYRNQSDHSYSVDEKKRRKRNHEFAHLIAVEFRIGFERKRKSEKIDAQKHYRVQNQNKAFSEKRAHYLIDLGAHFGSYIVETRFSKARSCVGASSRLRLAAARRLRKVHDIAALTAKFRLRLNRLAALCTRQKARRHGMQIDGGGTSHGFVTRLSSNWIET